MDTYTLVKFLHVAFVVVWLGGGFSLVVLGARANRANDTADLIKVIQQVVYMNHVFVPASLLAFLCGLILAWIAGLFDLLWVIIGLAGIPRHLRHWHRSPEAALRQGRRSDRQGRRRAGGR